VRKTGTRKKFCRQAPEQSVCTIKSNGCRDPGDPLFKVTHCTTSPGTENCYCTVTVDGYSRCSDADVRCAACSTDADCVAFAEQQDLPRTATFRCLSCPGCGGTACAASCQNPCQPGDSTCPA
jgi:hypothetical protein